MTTNNTQASQQVPSELPELPSRFALWKDPTPTDSGLYREPDCDVYTADQMREYADRAVREAVKGCTLVDHNYTWYRSDFYHSAVADARNAALEEAALECEKVDTDYYQHPTDKFACWTNRGSGCAGAIRHLKSASVSEQKGEANG